MCLYLFQALLIDKRAYLNTFFQAVPYPEFFNSGGQFFGKGIKYTVLYQEPIYGYAGLAGITEFTGNRATHRSIDIGIVKNEKRCIAAEFQRYFFDGAGGLFHQLAAYGCRAGEGDFPDLFVGG